ncbi:MAG: IPExxxVDY family protein [Flavobacteriaceae bacterium]
MTKTHKTYQLSLDELHDTYYLEGICSTLEGFELAFYLNQNAGSYFYRAPEDIDFPTANAFFSRFIWESEAEGRVAEFYANKYQAVLPSSQNLNDTLLDTPNLKEVYLLPEFKQLDFVLKVNDLVRLENIKSVLHDLSSVSLHYTIELNKIKNQMNLIFD